MFFSGDDAGPADICHKVASTLPVRCRGSRRLSAQEKSLPDALLPKRQLRAEPSRFFKGRTELRKFSWAPAGLVSLAAAPAPLLNLRWHVWPEGCSFSGSSQLGAQRRGANFRGRIAERSQTSGRVWNGSPPGAAVVAKSFQYDTCGIRTHAGRPHRLSSY